MKREKKNAATTKGRFVCMLLALCASVPGLACADVLYVSSRDNNRVEKFTSNGTESVFANISAPLGVAFDSAGNLFVATSQGVIKKYTPGGAGSDFVSYPGGSFNGLAFDRQGNLFAVSLGEIDEFAPDGTPSVFAEGISATSLAFDAAGNLYAAEGNTIGKFTPSGEHSLFATDSGVSGLAFDSAGNLYASNYFDSTIEKFSPDGADLGVFATARGSNLYGLAFDSMSNLYVARVVGSVEEFTSAGGVGSDFVSTSAPYYLAFTDDAGHPLSLPVPEPTSGVMLLALSAVKLMRRRPSTHIRA